MILGFTGTQQGMAVRQKNAFQDFLEQNKPTTFCHGDCIGADFEAHQMIENTFGRGPAASCNIEIFPPINPGKRAFQIGKQHTPKEYIQRNHDIVDASDILVATPKEDTEQLRSGTWATIRYALKKGKKVYVIYPNGRQESP